MDNYGLLGNWQTDARAGEETGTRRAGKVLSENTGGEEACHPRELTV